MAQVLCTLVQQLFIEHLFVKQFQEYSVKKKKKRTNKDPAGWPGKKMTLQLSPEVRAELLGQKVLASSPARDQRGAEGRR